MWIRIRAVIIEDEPLAAQYLAALLDDTCQVEVVGLATESEAGPRLCAELRPDAVFLDINLPGKDGVSLARQLAMLPQPPRLVFTTGHANRATDAFRLEAVDYLLKPLDPEQVMEAVNRLLAYLRPFEADSSPSSGDHVKGVPTSDKMRLTRWRSFYPDRKACRREPASHRTRYSLR
jgi:DNA-binding LytR/AlgR family response regulator